MESEKKFLSADEILFAQDLKTIDVDVPEWGGIVRFRPLSAAEAQEFTESFSKGRASDGMFWLIAKTAVDPNGSKLFTKPEHIELLKNKSMQVLMRLQDQLMELNGWGKGAKEAAKKDSGEVVH